LFVCSASRSAIGFKIRPFVLLDHFLMVSGSAEERSFRPDGFDGDFEVELGIPANQ
jgi:hypothetical protein